MAPAPQDVATWLSLELGQPAPCPYLNQRLSQLAFGVALPDATQLDDLLEQGFRRLGFVFYVPRCPAGCRECRPLRVPLGRFAPSRSQKRLLRRVAPRYQVRELTPRFDPSHFEIYLRHAAWVSEDNEPCTSQTYTALFVNSPVVTRLFEFHLDDRLIGVSILDEGLHAVSSVYAFWDPAFARASPGTFSALWEIEWARQRGKSHYYLGYWIAECRQMRYKSRFRPHELYDWQERRWIAATAETP